MTILQTALFLLCVALASCAQSLSGFAFALILLGLVFGLVASALIVLIRARFSARVAG